jgi:hypothetical protein
VEVVYPWGFYGTDLSTFVQHFVAKLQTNKQNTEGQKAHNTCCKFTPVCKMFIWWTDLEFIQATHKSNFSKFSTPNKDVIYWVTVT